MTIVAKSAISGIFSHLEIILEYGCQTADTKPDDDHLASMHAQALYMTHVTCM